MVASLHAKLFVVRRRSPKDQEGFSEIPKARSRIFRSYGDQPASLGPNYEVFDQFALLAFADLHSTQNLFVVEIVVEIIFGLMTREPKQKASFGGIH